MASTRSCSTTGTRTVESIPRKVSVPSKGSKRRRTGKLCQHPSGCSRFAQGATSLCIGHGGGRRCQFKGCPRSAVGRSDKCVSHGGGRRCEFPECTKSARGSTGFCFAHGGGARCGICGCGRVAYRSTGLCVNHGAGRKCDYPLCQKLARWPSTYCPLHQTIIEPRSKTSAESVSTETTTSWLNFRLALDGVSTMDCEDIASYSAPDTDDDSFMEGLNEFDGAEPLLDFLACCSGRLYLNLTGSDGLAVSSSFGQGTVTCALSARSSGALSNALPRFDEFLDH